MMSTVPLCAGLLAGLSIAVPIGPMSLLCIQRTLCGGVGIGLCTGLGAATVNVLYGTAVLFGLAWLGPWIDGGGRVLTAAGGLFLLWTAARTALRRRGQPGGMGPAEALSPLAAYGSAVGFNATNPMALVLIVALLSPSIAMAGATAATASVFLAGMFAAAMAWWLCLTGGVALLRTRLTPTVLLYVNQGAAMLLSLYGVAALMRSAGF